METLQHINQLSSNEQRVILVPPLTHEFIVDLQSDHASLTPHEMDNFWVDVQFDPYTSHEHYGLVIAAFLNDLPPEAMDGDIYTVRHKTTRMLDARNVKYDRLSVRGPAQVGIGQVFSALPINSDHQAEEGFVNENVVFTTTT